MTRRWYEVPKNALIFLAGAVWTIAGAIVAGTGLVSLGASRSELWWLLPGAVAVMLAFYLLVFAGLVRRHTARVRARPERWLPVWDFFDAKSYVVMAVMMAGGIGLRAAHLLPEWFIAFFYTGLGIALLSCGLRFGWVFGRRAVEQG